MCDEVDREKRQTIVFGGYETRAHTRHGHRNRYISVKNDDEPKIHPYYDRHDDRETFPDEGELPIVKVFCNGNSKGEIIGHLMRLVAKLRGEFSEEESKIFSDGLDVLMEKLGPSGMVNFMQILSPGYGDYTKERSTWDDKKWEEVMEIGKKRLKK